MTTRGSNTIPSSTGAARAEQLLIAVRDRGRRQWQQNNGGLQWRDPQVFVRALCPARPFQGTHIFKGGENARIWR